MDSNIVPTDEILDKINTEFEDVEPAALVDISTENRKRKLEEDSTCVLDLSDFNYDLIADVVASERTEMDQYFTAKPAPQSQPTFKRQYKGSPPQPTTRMSPLSVTLKLLSNCGRIPRQSTPRALTYELFSAQQSLIPPESYRSISTDIALEIPQGYCGKIQPHFVMSSRGIVTIAGVIDSDFRGHIKIMLHNINNGHSHQLEVGMVIAKITFERVLAVQFRRSIEHNAPY